MTTQSLFTQGATPQTTLEIQLKHMLCALGMDPAPTDFYESIRQCQEDTGSEKSALELGKAMGTYRNNEPVPFPVRKQYTQKGNITVVHEIQLLLPPTEHNALAHSVVEQRIADALRTQHNIFENVYLYENVPMTCGKTLAQFTGKKPRTFLRSKEHLCLNTYPFRLYDLEVDGKYVQCQQPYNPELMLAQVMHHLRGHLRHSEK